MSKIEGEREGREGREERGREGRGREERGREGRGERREGEGRGRNGRGRLTKFMEEELHTTCTLAAKITVASSSVSLLMSCSGITIGTSSLWLPIATMVPGHVWCTNTWKMGPWLSALWERCVCVREGWGCEEVYIFAVFFSAEAYFITMECEAENSQSDCRRSPLFAHCQPTQVPGAW